MTVPTDTRQAARLDLVNPIIAALASEPCRNGRALHVCAVEFKDRDPSHWCLPCAARHAEVTAMALAASAPAIPQPAPDVQTTCGCSCHSKSDHPEPGSECAACGHKAPPDVQAALADALLLCVKWMPCAEVRSWPPGFRLREEALAAADAALLLAGRKP